VHCRLYSPTLLGRFLSPMLGRYVVGTAHLDIGECGSAPVYGYREEAEEAVAAAAESRGWTVEEDSRRSSPFREPATAVLRRQIS
jgi:hypothetical protein